jgi:hypothetical protein
MVPGVGLWAHRRPRPLPWQRRRWTPQRSPEPRCWYWWEQAGYEARFTSWASGTPGRSRAPEIQAPMAFQPVPKLAGSLKREWHYGRAGERLSLDRLRLRPGLGGSPPANLESR